MREKKPSPDGFCRIYARSKSTTAAARERSAASRANEDIAIRLLSLQEEIQQRIASDLHDATCQHLIAASLNLLRLRRATGDTATAGQLLDDIDTSINQALQEIRAFSYLLHPRDLLDNGLKTTIEEYANGFSARTSLRSIVDIAPEVRGLPYETQCALLRIVQEALTNVFRHAHATQVTIIIQARRNNFRLCVIDDGCGIPNGQPKSGPQAVAFGVGIPGMRSRVRQLGGTFEIHSSTGQRRGTTVRALLPYPTSGETHTSLPSPHQLGHDYAVRETTKLSPPVGIWRTPPPRDDRRKC